MFSLLFSCSLNGEAVSRFDMTSVTQASMSSTFEAQLSSDTQLMVVNTENTLVREIDSLFGCTHNTAIQVSDIASVESAFVEAYRATFSGKFHSQTILV